MTVGGFAEAPVLWALLSMDAGEPTAYLLDGVASALMPMTGGPISGGRKNQVSLGHTGVVVAIHVEVAVILGNAIARNKVI